MKELGYYKRVVALLLVTSLVLGSSGLLARPTMLFAASSSFNKQINYQGRLTSASGSIVGDGSYNMIFRLYTASTGGSDVFTEVYTSTTTQITVTNGLFSVLLGQLSSLTDFNFNRDLYLSVAVGGSSTPPVWDPEMAPRKRLGAVPSAFEADKIDGLDSSQLIRSDDPGTIASSSTSTLFILSQAGTGNILSASSGSATVFVVANGGTVGIATTSPYAALSVVGASGVVADHYSATSTTATSTFAGGINTQLLFVSSTTASSTFSNGVNLTAGCFAVNGVCVSGSSSLTYNWQKETNFASLALTPTTTIPVWVKGDLYASSSLIVSASSTLGRATSTNLYSSTFGLNSEYFTDLTGAGLSNTAGVLTLNTTGDWTGTFDGSEGSVYLARANHTGTQAASTITGGTFGSGSFVFPAGSLSSLGSTTLQDFTANNATTTAATTTNFAISSFTLGSVPFIGTGGTLMQQNTSFFWDNTNNRLGVGTTSPWAQLSVEMDTSNPAFVVSNSGSSSPAFYVGGVNQDGRVGIGTVSPTGGLHVKSANPGNQALITSETTQTGAGGAANAGYQLVGGATNANWLMLTNRGDLTANGDDLFLFKNAGTTGVKFVVTDAGKVGIGTTTPGNFLDVTGATFPRIRVTATDANTGAGLHLMGRTGSVDNSWYLDNRGGAETPNNRLSFTSDDLVERFSLESTGAATATFSGPIVSNNTNATSTLLGSLAVGTTSVASSWALTVDGGLCLSRNTLCPATQIHGGIAIDNTLPGTTLTGTTFDIAETYSSKEPLAPGYIVTVDSDSPKVDMVKKGVLGDPLIGIISTSPAIFIDESFVKMGMGVSLSTSTRPAVALAGRVPVRVNLENGVIAKGDSISVSSEPGVGKKAKFGEQTVGIALESWPGKSSDGIYNSDKNGSVMVFVNLSAPRISQSISGDSIVVEAGDGIWSLSLSGEIIASKDINMSGRALKSVGAITSASGNWSINEAGILRAKELRADKLCLGETCVTETELKALMQGAGITTPIMSAEGSSPSQPTDPVTLEASSTGIIATESTEEVLPESPVSDAEEVIVVPASEPTAMSEPEPIPVVNTEPTPEPVSEPAPAPEPEPVVI